MKAEQQLPAPREGNPSLRLLRIPSRSNLLPWRPKPQIIALAGAGIPRMSDRLDGRRYNEAA